MLRSLRVFALSAALIITAGTVMADLKLLVVEQAGCVYCMRWDRDVGDAYHLTDEGRAAPLQRMQLHDPLPAGVTLSRLPAFTPTFVLLRDGDELARIEGYPGEDFFWGLLAQMIKTAQPKEGAPGL